MGVSLSDLVAQLTRDVPQRGNVPSSTQYQECVTKAVAAYGKRRPMLRRTALDVVAGTAEYDLPDDFWQLVFFQGWDQTAGVLITSGGLVPVPDSYTEDIEIKGRTLAIHPEPAYSWDDRILKYLAVHVLSGEAGSEEYAYLTGEDVEILMKAAQARALQLIANSMAASASDSARAGLRETDSSPLREVRQQIKELKQEYEADLARDNKAAPVLGHGYTQAELEALWV